MSDLVLSMIEDQQKNLWVISENTLAKFDPENGTFEHYNENHLQKEIYFSLTRYNTESVDFRYRFRNFKD